MGLFAKPDFMLLHPPSVYDFRERLVIPSPIADLIPASPLFEMYPIGFSFLGEYLERNGINTQVVNLAARMMEKPGFDVGRFLGRKRPIAFGIGLHWLPSCQGALEIARLCKEAHPNTPVIMGGYSASLFHRELLECPQVDYVLRGDSAEKPLLLLLGVLAGDGKLDGVPNLTYRDSSTGNVACNACEYVPDDLGYLGNNYLYMLRSAVKYRDRWGFRAFKGWWSYPMTMVLTCRGCLHNCTFCGGSNWSMERFFSRARPAFREPGRIAADVRTISRITGAPIFIVGDLRQNGDEYASRVLEALGRVSPENHVVLELFEPAPRRFFDLVASNLPHFSFEISPESHDQAIRAAVGKRYTNSDLEANLTWALEVGCGKFDVFFMIGLPGQTPESVMDTVSYCSRLLDRFGGNVNPLIGPLAPFLDPGSIAQTHPEQQGYRLLFNTLEEYRRAMLEPHWRDMLSYETECMSRQEIVDTTYAALLELNRAKGESGKVSLGYMEMVKRFLDDNIALLKRLDEADGTTGTTLVESDMSSMKEQADRLMSRSSLPKEELEWPVSGRKFRYASIVRMLLSK
ncbi:MAG: TIGR04190 family B12-binding domain/radical SAM domain protein [Actinobacteria bacterium]|nr:TIGR04190 family B12-binding domain/radical SAM domain protein [Actinomycetota bacterium]MCG2820084.1 TIGR04190 family B12-binding domain/radical SAM domain protein [Actinomycetes bacterium]MBU4219870.1 TIGR04190 family B12-binding domain/radical SAM domain protein [Actinomycetota bacterium]MBU4359760.1 TIGR04190 family B12-binding domain/radical SAM domain protein [Actinomycetota bacterium]MBU4392385.1 TIGR04190 family B12-binding domain/radical SAM domain protein [Actinomycetota bacterium]